MRLAPFAIPALYFASPVKAQNATLPSQDIKDHTAYPTGHKSGFIARLQQGSAHLGALASAQKTFSARDSYTNLATRHSMCLDVADGKFNAGVKPQIWTCVDGSANQQWEIDGTAAKTKNNLCLDIPDGVIGYGTPVQLWTCIAGNRNQMFEIAGTSIRRTGSNFCLDVRDGVYSNGAQLQMWACDWNTVSGNQVWNFGSAVQTSTQSPSSFLGYATISIDAFMKLHPECSAWTSSFVAAAAANGLVPTLLTAIAETESSCNSRPGNGWGLAQFSDDGAWERFGGAGKDRQNPVDAIWGMARYVRYLLDQNNQNLDSALRGYNGPISQGGNVQYQNQIRTWMAGGSAW